MHDEGANPPTVRPQPSRRAMLAAGIATPLTMLIGCSKGSEGGGPGAAAGTPSPAVPSGSAQSTRSGTLVAYFSRAGENYWYGGRRNLRVGNTRRLVDLITSRIDCDTYEIVAADPYPTAYEPTVERNVEELRANARPAIANPLPDLKRYRNILIGCPVWASRTPMIMSTFVEGVDLSGAHVLPFVTYAVSGMAGIDTYYRSELTNTTVVDGLAIQGEEVDASHSVLNRWLRTNGLLPQ